jgi:ATP-dependent DNA helicase RecQ
VFHDSTLREMVARRPRDRNQMLEVAGVGPVKFERYGDAFLHALNGEGDAA